MRNLTPRDSVTLIKQDGRKFILEARIGSEKILLFPANDNIPIQEGDIILRKLPSDVEETYVILDSVYFAGGRMLSPHYEIKAQKETDIKKDKSTSLFIENKGVFVVGDQFNQTGDFQGANIKSTLMDVNQTINNIPNVDQLNKDKLKILMEQLQEALGQVPQENAEEAEAVAEIAKALIESVSKEKPNKAMVEITGEGLKKAAKNIASVTPIVLPIAIEIVKAVSSIS